MNTPLATSEEVQKILIAALPESLKERMYLDSEFAEHLGMNVDTLITITSRSVSFTYRLSDLYGAITDAYTLEPHRSSFSLHNGDSVEVEISRSENEFRARIFNDHGSIDIPYVFALSPSTEDRRRYFHQMCSEIMLDSTSVRRWDDILLDHVLGTSEWERFRIDMQATPVLTMGKIAINLRQPEITFSSIVPQELGYYARLTGLSVRRADLAEYVMHDVAVRIRDLISTYKTEGLKLAVALCSHRSITSILNVDELSDDELENFYSWAASEGDLCSQLSAIELGLSLLSKHPKIVPHIEVVLGQLLSTSDRQNARWIRLSNLIAIVDGELAQYQVLRKINPFIRRHAAITHAALVERTMAATKIGIPDLEEQDNHERLLAFYVQTHLDAREEPFWRADYALSSRLRAEFLGRVYLAANENRSELSTPSLSMLVELNEDLVPRYLADGPNPFLSGPLEGHGTLTPPLTEAIRGEIFDRVKLPRIGLSGLVVASNVAGTFRMLLEDARRIAALLSEAEYAFDIDIDQPHEVTVMENIIAGLSHLAAETKCGELASSARVLCRLQRLPIKTEWQLEREAHFCLIAASAHSEIETWGKFISDWLTELSLQPMTVDQAGFLITMIESIGTLEPYIWKTCGAAYANLEVAVKMSNAVQVS